MADNMMCQKGNVIAISFQFCSERIERQVRGHRKFMPLRIEG
jgi:hypothetical protein